MAVETVVTDHTLTLFGAACAVALFSPLIVDACYAVVTAFADSVSVVHEHFTPLEPLVLEPMYPGEPPHFVDCPCCGPLEVHPLYIPAPTRGTLLDIILSGGDAMEFIRDYRARLEESYINQAGVQGFLERLHYRPGHVGRVGQFVRSLLSLFTTSCRGSRPPIM